MLWRKMKTDTQVSKSNPNLKVVQHAKDWVYLVISHFFKGEGPYVVENKETFFFPQAWEADSTTIPSFCSQSECVKYTIQWFGI